MSAEIQVSNLETIKEQKVIIQTRLTQIKNEWAGRRINPGRYQRLCEERTKLTDRLSLLELQLAKAKKERQETYSKIPMIDKKETPGHIAWCLAFVDIAKKELPDHLWATLKKIATAKVNNQPIDLGPDSDGLNWKQRQVLDLFPAIGITMTTLKLYELILERTAFSRPEMMDLVSQLTDRGHLDKVTHTQYAKIYR